MSEEFTQEVYVDGKLVISKSFRKSWVISKGLTWEGSWEQACNRMYNKTHIKCARNSDAVSTFIQKSTSVHGNRYDYSLVRYTNNRTKVEILCAVHGVFIQTPNNHYEGKGCSICGKTEAARHQLIRAKDSSSTFIPNSILKHGVRYGYHLVEYINSRIKVKIVCYDHGPFYQIPACHLAGQGCPKCVNRYKKYEEKAVSVLKAFGVAFKREQWIQVSSKRYRVDFIVENRFILEIDEPHHLRHQYKDHNRQNEITEQTGLPFMRIKVTSMLQLENDLADMFMLK